MDMKSLYDSLSHEFITDINPHHEEAFKKTVEWVHKFKLTKDQISYDKMIKSNPAKLAAYAYFDINPDIYQLETDLHTWFYLHDDMWIDSETKQDPDTIDQYHNRMIDVLLGNALITTDDHPLLLSLYDLCLRIKKMSKNGDNSLFIYQMIEYLTAKSWESRLNEKKIIPDLYTYIEMRRYGGGVYPCLDVACLGGIDLPVWILRSNAHVKAIASYTSDLICWGNDLFSYEKEVKEGITINLVMIVKKQFSLSEEEAIKYTINMWNKHKKEYQKLTTQLLEIPSLNEYKPDLKKYINMTHLWFNNYLDYARDCARFT